MRIWVPKLWYTLPGAGILGCGCVSPYPCRRDIFRRHPRTHKGVTWLTSIHPDCNLLGEYLTSTGFDSAQRDKKSLFLPDYFFWAQYRLIQVFYKGVYDTRRCGMKWTTTLAGLVCAIGSVVSHTIFSGGCDFNIEFRKSDFDFIAMTLESVEFCFFLNYVQIILKYFHYIFRFMLNMTLPFVLLTTCYC